MRVPIRENTDVAEARRSAAGFSRAIALDEEAAGRLAIVVTEAATNIIKHGGGGAMLLGPREERGEAWVEVLAMDQGPGIENVARSSQDGYSTAGSPGNGLGAIMRLSAAHEIYSRPGAGTIIMARVSNRRTTPHRTEQFQTGAVCVPKESETVCGDAWISQSRFSGLRVLLADGLGHGVHAAEASGAAVALAVAHPDESAVQCLDRVHAGLRSTRGAAVSIAEINSQERTVRYAGLGNVAGAIAGRDGARRQMVSHNGTAGHHARKLQDFSYPWAVDSTLILHSDGIATHWSLEAYPGLLRCHASVIAAVLYRDFQRGRDDATVVVARATPGREVTA